MLGFATVDLSTRDDSLAVWLTSVGMDIPVAHTNAVRFDLASDAAPRRAWSMLCDRYVVLTNRTPRDHTVIVRWDVAPCDLAMLAKQTTAAQEALMAASLSPGPYLASTVRSIRLASQSPPLRRRPPRA
jgi:hypothetical protein